MPDDMDVDDIINGLQPQGGTRASRDEDLRTDAAALKRAWMNERFAPELLSFENELLKRIMKRISEKASGDTPSPQKNMDRTLTPGRVYRREK